MSCDIKIISKYLHDATFINVIQTKSKIEISIESVQLKSDWNKDNIELSNIKTIRGKLHVEEIKKIVINGKQVQILKKEYDSGEILDFEVLQNGFFMLVEWINYPPKIVNRTTDSIIIEASKIYWENIPDLEVSF
jgi:hypothetical protein